MRLLLFEDNQVADLTPIATSRPAFEISCAGYRLVDLVTDWFDGISASVRQHLQESVRQNWGWEAPNPSDGSQQSEDWLLLNARVAPLVANLKVLHGMISGSSGKTDSSNIYSGSEAIVQDGVVLAAVIPADQLASVMDAGFTATSAEAAGCEIDKTNSLIAVSQLHELIQLQCDHLSANLQHRIERGNYREIADGVFSADATFQLVNHVVAGTSEGPIVLETGCTIGPFSFLEGPIHLGANNRVAEHSSIKDAVSTGTTCKLGGEIEATIIEAFSNKQHHGFLGHSYLGSWINLGAGTCNSDLKNTYGKVNMRRRGEKISTGMQFVGCFIGDYSKTAINTSIFTGKTIGVCSMVYGFAVHDIAAFTNDARMLGKVTEVDPAVMIQTQARMFNRRNVEQRECDKRLIESMFSLTQDQRVGLEREPLTF